MKHLSSLHQTFPHLPNRGAIMGLVQKKKTPVEMAEEEVDVKQRSSQFVTVKVYFTVRPHLPPCHCAVVSVPLAARCSELLETSWGLFLEFREKMGSFVGPAPSDNMNDYMLCFTTHDNTPNSYQSLLAEISRAISADRRKSSVVPTSLSPGKSPFGNDLAVDPGASSNIPAITLDQLLVGKQEHGASGTPSTSPAASALGLPPRRRSRSASVVSSTTVVTEEPLGGEDDHVPASDGEDEDDEGRPLSAHEESVKNLTIVDKALQEFKTMLRASTAVAKVLPRPEQVCEECPPSAIVSRLVANRLKKKSDSEPAAAGEKALSPPVASSSAKLGALIPEVDDGLVSLHLMLKPLFVERELTALTEEKTRRVTERIFDVSWLAMQKFEQTCREQTKVFEVRRANELEQIRAFQEREAQIRLKHVKFEHTSWVEAIAEFRKRYNELEVGMIAQYRLMRELRQRHASKMEELGLTPLNE